MHAALEHDDQVSPPTYRFLIALLLNAITHAVAMTLFDPGVTPAPATAPLRLSIPVTPTPATTASTPAPVADHQAPEAVPEMEPKPVIKRVRRPQPPQSHPQASAAPTHPETAAPAPEHPMVVASSRPPVTPAAVSTMAVTALSRKVEYLYNPPPDYPPRARRLGLEGEVLIRTRCCRTVNQVNSYSDNRAAMRCWTRPPWRQSASGDSALHGTVTS
jgi:periplasmic protein TonB